VLLQGLDPVQIPTTASGERPTTARPGNDNRPLHHRQRLSTRERYREGTTKRPPTTHRPQRNFPTLTPGPNGCVQVSRSKDPAPLPRRARGRTSRGIPPPEGPAASSRARRLVGTVRSSSRVGQDISARPGRGVQRRYRLASGRRIATAPSAAARPATPRPVARRIAVGVQRLRELDLHTRPVLRGERDRSTSTASSMSPSPRPLVEHEHQVGRPRPCSTRPRGEARAVALRQATPDVQRLGRRLERVGVASASSRACGQRRPGPSQFRPDTPRDARHRWPATDDGLDAGSHASGALPRRAAARRSRFGRGPAADRRQPAVSASRGVPLGRLRVSLAAPQSRCASARRAPAARPGTAGASRGRGRPSLAVRRTGLCAAGYLQRLFRPARAGQQPLPVCAAAQVVVEGGWTVDGAGGAVQLQRLVNATCASSELAEVGEGEDRLFRAPPRPPARLTGSSRSRAGRSPTASPTPPARRPAGRPC